MAVDKLVDSNQLNSNLSTVANAIRIKGGTSDSLSFPTGFVNAIAQIDVGRPTYTATVTSSGNNYCKVIFNDVSYYTEGDTFIFHEGDSLEIYESAEDAKFFINGSLIDSIYDDPMPLDSIYSLPNCDIEISFSHTTVPVSTYRCYITTADGKQDNRALILRTITTYEDLDLNKVGPYGFAGCYDLSSVNLPNCKTIGTQGMFSCTSLTTISMPICTNIGASAFRYCNYLSEAYFPKCEYIGMLAFGNCTRLTTISFPMCKSIDMSAFSGCASLTSIYFPECTRVTAYAFYSTSNLTEVNLPKCSAIGNSVFAYCRNLSSVNAPSVISLGSYAFLGCSSLQIISLPICSRLEMRTFSSCVRLTSLYLMSGSVVSLTQSDAFSSTPIGGYSDIAGTFGSVFVPSSLASAYKSATNWTYFSDRIVGI